MREERGRSVRGPVSRPAGWPARDQKVPEKALGAPPREGMSGAMLSTRSYGKCSGQGWGGRGQAQALRLHNCTSQPGPGTVL